MALETKVFNTKYHWLSQQEIIEHYSSFGWQTIGVTNDRITMNREVNIEHYQELVALENDYVKYFRETDFALDKSIMNIKLAIFLFFLFIVPMVLYILNKKKWKKKAGVAFDKMEDAVTKGKALFYSSN
ncbi:hypothetical protein ACJA25_02710 [Mycoplasmopsis hyopharyngis]|uniref:hypothetical protein n=1 Tax=Mycoplasmopsis hyopharyngis TaxID=29558 RepID=UPI003872B766